MFPHYLLKKFNAVESSNNLINQKTNHKNFKFTILNPSVLINPFDNWQQYLGR